MGYEIPDFGSNEFANNPLFKDNALEVPVLWLSISLFLRQFMPKNIRVKLVYGTIWYRRRVSSVWRCIKTLWIQS